MLVARPTYVWNGSAFVPIAPAATPLPATGAYVMSPAQAGPRADNATIARFGHISAQGSNGFDALSDGRLDAIFALGATLAIYELTTPPTGFNEIARFFRDATYGGRMLCGDFVLGGSMHPGFTGVFKNGAGAGDYALIQDNSYNTLLNGRGNVGIKTNNGGLRFYCDSAVVRIDGPDCEVRQNGANRFWASGGNTFIDVGGGTFFGRLSGNDKFAYNNSQFNTYVQLAVRASVGTNPWDQANIVCTSSMDMQRIAFNSPGIAPQLRSNSVYGDHLEVINNPGSGYSNIRAAAFPVASSLAIKRDVRPIRVRDLPPISHDPRMDTVPDLNIMALRPVAFRPKVPALMIVGKEKKKTVPRPIDDLRGHEGSRERLGLIAEEVEKVIPSAVDHYKDGSMGAIDYAQITVALLDHVQRLTDEVATLRYRIAELEKA